MSISEHGEFIYFQKVVFQLNFLTFIEFFNQGFCEHFILRTNKINYLDDCFPLRINTILLLFM